MRLRFVELIFSIILRRKKEVEKNYWRMFQAVDKQVATVLLFATN